LHDKLLAESHWVRHGPKTVVNPISLEGIDIFLDDMSDSIFPRKEKKVENGADQMEQGEFLNSNK
jgi:hypothetical protein